MTRQKRNGSFSRIQKSLKTLGQSRLEIAALYLFGSTATGKAGPLSDVDIAILLDETRIKPQKFFDYQLELITEAMSVCHRSDVDVILLNEATPLLTYEVVRSGSLLYEREHGQRVAFEAHALQRYLDLKPFFETTRKYLKHHLQSGTFGG